MKARKISHWGSFSKSPLISINYINNHLLANRSQVVSIMHNTKVMCVFFEPSLTRRFLSRNYVFTFLTIFYVFYVCKIISSKTHSEFQISDEKKRNKKLIKVVFYLLIFFTMLVSWLFFILILSAIFLRIAVSNLSRDVPTYNKFVEIFILDTSNKIINPKY